MNAKIDISNVAIKTERLLLRPWRKSDLDDFYHYARVDGVGQMAGWLPHENKKVSKKILEQFIEEKFVLAITLMVLRLVLLVLIRITNKNFLNLIL